MITLALLTWFTGITSSATLLKEQTPLRASFYADAFEGHPMAGGGRFHQNQITAASRTFPLGTLVRVTSVATGKSIVVRITDRGPWGTRYKLDLSKAAFRALGLSLGAGWGWVTVVASPDGE